MTTSPRHSAFTLIEILVVVGIVAILLALVAPNLGSMVQSQRMASAANLIKTALAQAQAHAAKNQKYTGVRFQYKYNYFVDSGTWEMDRQYLVLIEHNNSNTYNAILNAKPIPLPTGIGVIPLEAGFDGRLGDNISDRFGLWLSFYPPTQDEYLAIIDSYFPDYPGDRQHLHLMARQFAQPRASRSGRTAKQFFNTMVEKSI